METRIRSSATRPGYGQVVGFTTSSTDESFCLYCGNLVIKNALLQQISPHKLYWWIRNQQRSNLDAIYTLDGDGECEQESDERELAMRIIARTEPDPFVKRQEGYQPEMLMALQEGYEPDQEHINTHECLLCRHMLYEFCQDYGPGDPDEVGRESYEKS